MRQLYCASLLALASVLALSTAYASGPDGPPPPAIAPNDTVPQKSSAPPPPPQLLDDGSKSEPSVTIRKDGDKSIEEYRLNGQLYMIKVTPKIGPPYYLMDKDGSGTMSPYDLKDGHMMIPHWVLFTF